MKKRIRRGARILLRKPDGSVLLFKFAYTQGVLAGSSYWALPGGGLDDCETPAAAAVRELFEETGIRIADPGPVLFEAEYDMTLMVGEDVRQHDYYFVVPVDAATLLSRDGFTPEERETLVDTRWWRIADLAASGEERMPAHLEKVMAQVIAADEKS